MIIRKAEKSDIPVLISFQQLLARETEGIELDAQILQLGMTALFDNPSKGFYNVVEDQGSVFACHMITYEWSDWRNGIVWWLQSVYVVEEQRKNGVFKLMYDNILNTIRKDPAIKGLRLYVDKSNTKAMKVYESVGMNGEHYTLYEWMKP